MNNMSNLISSLNISKEIIDILKSNNIFHTFKIKNDLCIIQSEYDIKYYENLFI